MCSSDSPVLGLALTGTTWPKRPKGRAKRDQFVDDRDGYIHCRFTTGLPKMHTACQRLVAYRMVSIANARHS